MISRILTPISIERSTASDVGIERAVHHRVASRCLGTTCSHHGFGRAYRCLGDRAVRFGRSWVDRSGGEPLDASAQRASLGLRNPLGFEGMFEHFCIWHPLWGTRLMVVLWCCIEEAGRVGIRCSCLGVSTLSRITASLVGHGMDPGMPAVVAQDATACSQQCGRRMVQQWLCLRPTWGFVRHRCSWWVAW